MADSYSKIGPNAFKAAVGTFFAVAIVSALGRFYVRVRIYGRLLLDDMILIFACLTLIASISLSYLNPANNIYVDVTLSQLIEDEKLQDIDSVLFWVTIYAVKFSFLSFFKGLISGVQGLNRWWWFVLLMTIPAAGFCSSVNYIVCPYIGPEIVEKCADTTHLSKDVALVRASTFLDILTDVLINLLWRVQITLRRKLALGAVLCLSIFMIIVSIIKVTSVYTIGQHLIDVPWAQFWGEIEACIAVTMASLSAYRSLFVANERQRKENKERREEDQKRLDYSPGALQSPSGGSGPLKIPTAVIRSALRTFGWDNVESSGGKSEATSTIEPIFVEQPSLDLQSHHRVSHDDMV